MAENTPPPVTDEKQTESKLKQWFNEVLDEREAKAVAEREEAEKLEKEKAAKQPASIINTLFGKL